MGLLDSENRVELGCIVSEIELFKSVTCPASRPAAHTQICPFKYKEELRSALPAPLVIILQYDILQATVYFSPRSHQNYRAPRIPQPLTSTPIRRIPCKQLSTRWPLG